MVRGFTPLRMDTCGEGIYPSPDGHLWRGDLSPFGDTVVAKPYDSVYLINRVVWFWGSLRNPAGINPLTTLVPSPERAVMGGNDVVFRMI